MKPQLALITIHTWLRQEIQATPFKYGTQQGRRSFVPSHLPTSEAPMPVSVSMILMILQPWPNVTTFWRKLLTRVSPSHVFSLSGTKKTQHKMNKDNKKPKIMIFRIIWCQLRLVKEWKTFLRYWRLNWQSILEVRPFRVKELFFRKMGLKLRGIDVHVEVLCRKSVILMIFDKYIFNSNPMESNEQYKQILAYGMYTLGCLLWVLAFIYPNENNFAFYQTSFIRGITGIVLAYIICRWKGYTISFPQKPTYHFLLNRNLIMTAQGCSVAFAQFYLPLPIVHTLCSSGPLFVFLLDFYMNGTRINFKQVGGIMLGLLGLIFTANGPLLITYVDPSFKHQSQFENYRSHNPLILLVISVLLIATNGAWGYGMILTKMMKKEVNPVQILFYLGVILAFVSSLFMCHLGVKSLTMQKMLIGILVQGIPMIVVGFFHMKAVQMTKNTGVLTMINFSMVLMGYFLSLFLYDETQNPVSLLGTAAIFFGVLITVCNDSS